MKNTTSDMRQLRVRFTQEFNWHDTEDRGILVCGSVPAEQKENPKLRGPTFGFQKIPGPESRSLLTLAGSSNCRVL